MKAAISLPERMFRKADLHARRMGKSRDQLIADALQEYMARHVSKTPNGKATNGTRLRRPPVKARFTRDQLKDMARRSPPPNAWFQEPQVDLTKPA